MIEERSAGNPLATFCGNQRRVTASDDRDPKGFLKVIDDTTLAYADFRGNGQYISSGNLNSGNWAALILMDYAKQRRLKIWTEVTILDAKDDTFLLKKLAMPDY